MKTLFIRFFICTLLASFSSTFAFIINGEDADVNEFPWMVAIHNEAAAEKHFCGASFIKSEGQNLVVTAAHCVDPSDYRVPFDTLVLKFGVYTTGGDGDGKVYALKDQRVHIHPKYGLDDVFDYDYAVIELNERVTDHEPIELYLDTDIPLQDMGTVIGWGDTDTLRHSPPEVLQKVDIPVLAESDNHRCRNLNRAPITGSMICAGVPSDVIGGGKDICRRDSGGPLMVKGLDNKIYQIGVVSHSENGCGTNSYGVYARIPVTHAGFPWD